MKQYIDTKLGVAVILIIAITMGAFVWKWGKEKDMNDGIRDMGTSTITKQDVVINDNSNVDANDAFKKYISSDKSFSIEYPREWKNDGTIFTDTNGVKIAEFSPGITALQPNQKCFDDLENNANRIEIISQNDVVINNRRGVLLNTKVLKDPGGGLWFPSMYCMYEKNQAFIMTFYNQDQGSDKKDLYDRIMATLKVE